MILTMKLCKISLRVFTFYFLFFIKYLFLRSVAIMWTISKNWNVVSKSEKERKNLMKNTSKCTLYILLKKFITLK